MMPFALKSTVLAAAVRQETYKPVLAQEKHDDLFFTILTLKVLDNSKTYGGLAWHMWHKDEKLDKSWVMCKYAKQLIALEVKQHTFDEKHSAKNKMLASLTTLNSLNHKAFWKAVNKILNNPEIERYL